MIATKCRQNMSSACWMGKQDLSDCDYLSAERERYLLDGKAVVSGCDYMSKEPERYLLYGEAGFE